MWFTVHVHHHFNCAGFFQINKHICSASVNGAREPAVAGGSSGRLCSDAVSGFLEKSGTNQSDSGGSARMVLWTHIDSRSHLVNKNMLNGVRSGFPAIREGAGMVGAH